MFYIIIYFASRPGMLSESEVEDDPNSHVTLPQTLSSRGNIAQSKSSVRLFELGPRMTLQVSPLCEHEVQ